MWKKYIGHQSQLYGVEEVKLVGGKAEGMRIFQMRNAAGLRLDISADRCADISRLFFKGDNMGYFAPCGYTAPSYYDKDYFLKNFTAGFMTTCGLDNVGPACESYGNKYAMHGEISNMPCERIWWEDTSEEIVIHAIINTSFLFGKKVNLHRMISCKKFINEFKVHDCIENYGDSDVSIMLLYHINMGFPMLCEKTKLSIASKNVKARDERAEEGIETWDKMLLPTPGFQEQCYFHEFERKGKVEIYNPMLEKGMRLAFDTNELPHFTQWKQMGIRDYVLGVEPGTCNPIGRKKAEKEGQLFSVPAGESKEFTLQFTFFEQKDKKQKGGE